MRRLACLASLLALAGCGGPALVAKPADGYEAIRVKESFNLAVPPFGVTKTFTAGTVYVADRLARGKPVYCRLVEFDFPDCVGYDADTVSARAYAGIYDKQPIMPGAIEQFRLK